MGAKAGSRPKRGTVSFDTARKLALALPGVEEYSVLRHAGVPRRQKAAGAAA